MVPNSTDISRVTRSREQAEASYDRMSRWYDLLAGTSERKFAEMGLRELHVREGEIVLEIGFGTGHCILALAEAVGQAGKVHGIDIAQGMLDITLARVTKAGLLSRVQLTRGDAVNLPFEAGLFDAILMSFTLELFDTPEIPAVLHECHRVLGRAGRIAVIAMSKQEEGGVMMKLYEWAHGRFPNYVDCRPIFVQRALEDAGFQVAKANLLKMWGLPVEIVLAKNT